MGRPAGIGRRSSSSCALWAAPRTRSTGIYLPLEPVESARFALPDPAQVGDHRSCRLLRDAVRLSFALGRRPLPLLRAHRRRAASLSAGAAAHGAEAGPGAACSSPTMSASAKPSRPVWSPASCSIAARSHRLAVLCPPHLAEQWQTELRDKFRIDAELVLPSTAGRLERNRYRVDQSLFDLYPHVVVSMDFIKSDRQRDDFVRACPELVIVDEAHTCAYGYEDRGSRHQRHQLVRRLAADPHRHLLLVTATPHSGKEAAFRSLLSLLNPDFAHLPEDLDRARKRLPAASPRCPLRAAAAGGYSPLSADRDAVPATRRTRGDLQLITSLSPPVRPRPAV